MPCKREGRFTVQVGPDEAALLAYCAERLAVYKRPGKIVFVSEIPRTANGKVSRRALPQVG